MGSRLPSVDCLLIYPLRKSKSICSKMVFPKQYQLVPSRPLSVQINKISASLCNFKLTTFHKMHTKVLWYGANIKKSVFKVFVCLFQLITKLAGMTLAGLTRDVKSDLEYFFKTRFASRLYPTGVITTAGNTRGLANILNEVFLMLQFSCRLAVYLPVLRIYFAFTCIYQAFQPICIHIRLCKLI